MQQNKLDAIYALVEAAEEKAVAEVTVTSKSTPENRDALLDAQLRLDAKTQDAIEACHECGGMHGPHDQHVAGHENVINVKFGNGDEKGK
jgi:hypothetical protein